MQGNGELDLKSLPPDLLPRALELVEQRVAKQEKKRNELEKALTDPDLYNRPDEFQATMAKFNKEDKVLQNLMTQWEELAALMETTEPT